MNTLVTLSFLFAFAYIMIEASPALDVESSLSEEARGGSCAETHQECIAGDDCSCCGNFDKCDCIWNEGVQTCKCEKIVLVSDWKKSLNCPQQS
uniref:U12-Theriditoxin-Lha1a_3 n=1 Tax=Latrodectus hasselti TaxID=256736 RepID=A0A482ZD69_LATHA